jgi:adenosylcobinamide kinase/adenosylcobinamide-phosphate guanylyltransferase
LTAQAFREHKGFALSGRQEAEEMAILVTGGARSGKSSFAEKLALHNRKQAIYIATAQIYDEEMSERVALHQNQRQQAGFVWVTMEESYDLSSLIRQIHTSQSNPAVLVDCLTLWLSNWLLRYEEDMDRTAKVLERIDELVAVVSSCEGHLVLVTNEVGSGIVPETPLGRSFRDLAGKMNQKLAEVCGQVFLVTAGIPIELKSAAFRLE